MIEAVYVQLTFSVQVSRGNAHECETILVFYFHVARGVMMYAFCLFVLLWSCPGSVTDASFQFFRHPEYCDFSSLGLDHMLEVLMIAFFSPELKPLAYAAADAGVFCNQSGWHNWDDQAVFLVGVESDVDRINGNEFSGKSGGFGYCDQEAE